jgi:hypothetical protein
MRGIAAGFIPIATSTAPWRNLRLDGVRLDVAVLNGEAKLASNDTRACAATAAKAHDRQTRASCANEHVHRAGVRCARASFATANPGCARAFAGSGYDHRVSV